MKLFIIVDHSESGKDFIVSVIIAEDEDTAIDYFCENSVATREDFDEGPLEAIEQYARKAE